MINVLEIPPVVDATTAMRVQIVKDSKKANMKLNVEKEELVSIWSDVIESLDIMRAFQNGEVRSVDAKGLGRKGCLKLGRARNKLKNLIGNAFVPSS